MSDDEHATLLSTVNVDENEALPPVDQALTLDVQIGQNESDSFQLVDSLLLPRDLFSSPKGGSISTPGDTEQLNGWSASGHDHSPPLSTAPLTGSIESKHPADGATSAPTTAAPRVTLAPNGAAERPVTAKRRRKPTARDEIRTLEATVHELENELVGLHARSGDTVSSVWEEMAQRQFMQRRDAEMENIQLRTMLESHLGMAARLRQVLFRKRCSVELLYPPSADTPEKRRRTYLDTDELIPLTNPALVEDLRSSLLGMHDRADSILADPRLHLSSRSVGDVLLTMDEECRGPSVEITAVRVFPYSFRETARAVWNMSLERMRLSCRSHRENVQVTDDTITSVFASVIEVPGQMGEFHGTLVSRQFVAKHRIVVAWAMTVEPININGSPIDSAVIRFRGWDVVRPAGDSVRLNTGEQAAIVQSFHEAVPEVHGHQDDRFHKAEALARLVKTTIATHLSAEAQATDRLLVNGGSGARSNISAEKLDT